MSKTISGAMRVEVAMRYGCEPGGKADVWCDYCGVQSYIIWFPRMRYAALGCDPRGHRMEFDHVVPLSRGGPHAADNLTVACRRCNRSKGAKVA